MINLQNTSPRHGGTVRRRLTAGGRRVLIGGSLLLSVLAGPVQSPVSATPARPHRPKAWIDAVGVCTFPLGPGQLPASRQELIDSMSTAWGHAVTLPDPSKVVQIVGGRYPAVDSFLIDLSDATMHPRPAGGGKAPKVVPNGKPEHRLGVGSFQLKGSPLMCEKAKLNLDISASSVRLDMEHDRAGHPILVLADAKKAQLQFDANTHDLEQLVLASARDAAAPYGLTVESASLQFDAESSRSISVKLHVLTKFGFIPAGMSFKAHVDIDDKMNARLTGLKIEGDEVLGPLIVGLLRPGLAQYEGKTRPLISFPADMSLRDVKISVDDAVHLTAAFGSGGI